MSCDCDLASNCEDEINELQARIDELEDQTRGYEYLVTGAQLLVENARVAHERDHRHSLKWCPEIMCASLRDHGLMGGDQ